MGIIAEFYLTFRAERGAFFALVCILSGRSSFFGPQNGVTGEVPWEEDREGEGLIPEGEGRKQEWEDREVGSSWAVSTEPVSMKSSKIMAFWGCQG